MLHAFGHHVATCCDVLRYVGCCWLKFETGQIFYATFVDVAWCCSRLARFVQQCCARACALVLFSTGNTSQHLATCCAQQCWDMLRRNVAIVWSGLENTGPTMLRYVGLNCCDRLAGALWGIKCVVWRLYSFGGVRLSVVDYRQWSLSRG